MFPKLSQKKFSSTYLCVLLIVAAVCHQVAVTYATESTGTQESMLMQDDQNKAATTINNTSNQHLPKNTTQNKNFQNVNDTVTETDVVEENITEFLKKGTTTPIIFTTIRMHKSVPRESKTTNNISNKSIDNKSDVVNNVTKNGYKLLTNLTVEINSQSENNTELFENVTKISTAVTKAIDFTEKIEITNNNSNEKTDEKFNSKAYGNDKISETPVVEDKESGNTESAGSGFKLNATPHLNSTDKNTSSTICVLPVNDNGTIKYIELNQTYINITSCERDRFHKFCIGLIISLAVLWLITIIIFCVWRFKLIKMMGRRAEEEKVENYQNFCISAAAEQMVSVEEKFSQQ